MSIQLIVGFYAAVSLLMIGFDLLFLQWERLCDWRLERRTARLSTDLREEMARNLDFPDEAHRRMLVRRLRSLPGMESFDRTLERARAERPDAVDRYLLGVSSVFERLAPYFSRRDELRRAYFAFIVRRWYLRRPAGPVLMQALQEDTRARALYTRENALEAIVAVGEPADVARAVVALGEAGVSHSRRLVSEALLAYPGDGEGLADALLARFDELSVPMRVCVVNYLRLSGPARHGGGQGAPGDRYAFLLSVLCDESAGKDVRLACVRFFARRPWDGALEPLLGLARREGPTEWEYAAVAASALASYPGERSVRALKGCLRSPVYQVRFNAAKALYGMGLSLEGDLADVLAGDDAYAREMLLYRWKVESEVLGAAPDAAAPASLGGGAS